MGRRGSEDDFRDFVQTRSGRLRLIARTLCGNRDLADDLVQEALERTWMAWARLDDPDPFAWTRRVLVNLNIDRMRRRRWREHSLDDSADEGPALSGAGSTTAEQVVNQQWIALLLDGLTPKERATVVLRHLEDLSEAQTAAELGIAVGTVKSTCARALEKLRRRAAASPGSPSARPTSSAAASQTASQRGTAS